MKNNNMLEEKNTVNLWNQMYSAKELDKIYKKVVLVALITCKASIEDAAEFLQIIFGKHFSIGKISSILKEASIKAREFNESINLSEIKTGANDEIFQSKLPILVGVEPKSNYVYLMELAKNRDSTTWGVKLLDKSAQGLDLKKSVNDAGTGLQKGLKEAYPELLVSLDVFHSETDFVKGITALENKAYSKIKKDYVAYKKLKMNKPSLDEAYIKAFEETELSIMRYENCKILYLWFKESLSIGGLTYDERIQNLRIISDLLQQFANENAYLKRTVSYINNNIEDLMMFVKDFEARSLANAKEEGIDNEIFKLLWEQYSLDPSSYKYNILESKIGLLTGSIYTRCKDLFCKLIQDTIRASSIVENINSLLRPYLTVKRNPNQRLLDILQLYFNTRKFRRSSIPNKISKSPLELLTGNKHMSYIEILGY